MNEVLEPVSTAPQEPPEDATGRLVELGSWIGRREAFALVAGRCSAADVECLRRLREERNYSYLKCNWDAFCTRYLKVSRRSADRMIGYLEEFGPAYFHLTKLTHVTVSEYRQIAASVSEAGVELDGSVVALLPENTSLLSAAIMQLLERTNTVQETNLLEAPVEPVAELVAAPIPVPPVAAAPELTPAQRILQSCAVIQAAIAEWRAVESYDIANVSAALYDAYMSAKRSRHFPLPG
jgi:hypothetical protein